MFSLALVVVEFIAILWLFTKEKLQNIFGNHSATWRQKLAADFPSRWPHYSICLGHFVRCNTNKAKPKCGTSLMVTTLRYLPWPLWVMQHKIQIEPIHIHGGTSVIVTTLLYLSWSLWVTKHRANLIHGMSLIVTTLWYLPWPYKVMQKHTEPN
jgi:hypothetical protein